MTTSTLITAHPLSPLELSQVRQWLQKPECLLFKRVLKSNAFRSQQLSGETLAKGFSDPHYLAVAQRHAARAAEFGCAVELLDEFEAEVPSLPLETVTVNV